MARRSCKPGCASRATRPKSREAEAIGPSTIALVKRILTAKPVRSYGAERLEAACQRHRRVPPTARVVVESAVTVALLSLLLRGKTVPAVAGDLRCQHLGRKPGPQDLASRLRGCFHAAFSAARSPGTAHYLAEIAIIRSADVCPTVVFGVAHRRPSPTWTVVVTRRDQQNGNDGRLSVPEVSGPAASPASSAVAKKAVLASGQLGRAACSPNGCRSMQKALG